MYNAHVKMYRKLCENLLQCRKVLVMCCGVQKSIAECVCYRNVLVHGSQGCIYFGGIFQSKTERT